MDAVVWQLRSIADGLAHRDDGEPLRVLVVDDNETVGRLVATCVKQAAPRAELLCVRDAQGALEVFRQRPPHLVFLDLLMPGMSGFELFTYLRGVNLVDAGTVVVMSAEGSATDVQLMLELGVRDFIPKGPELGARVIKIVQMMARPAERTTKRP